MRTDTPGTISTVTRVIALFGPTAVGKTDVAVALARRLRDRGERPVAVGADALQVYAGLEVLTGVADAAQRAELEHRLVGFLPVTDSCSAGAYARLAHAEIDGLLAEGATPIVVGGTGLYLRAALADLGMRPPPRPGVRERLTGEMAAEGPEALHERLRAVLPDVAARIQPTDRTRVIRALELHEQGVAHGDGGELWTSATRHPTRLIGLTMDRALLAQRIGERVDAMVAAGAVAEVRRADAAGASRTARAALGFTELLKGDITGMKTRTRRYAKRQLTWMRKLPGAELVDVTGRDPADVAAALLP
jgi:tRNA dimethylallyltransferase